MAPIIPLAEKRYSWDIHPENFCKELATARTFVMKQEAEWLQTQGLCQHVKHDELIVFSDEGPIDNELRFEDECVRHKMLDMVGDFALTGCDIQGFIIAHRSGHRLNAELARVLSNEAEIQGGYRRCA